LFQLVVLAFKGGGGGSCVGSRQGKDADGGIRVGEADGPDDGAGCRAGGEEVVDNEPMAAGWVLGQSSCVGKVDGVDALQFFFSLWFGEGLDGEGGPCFLKEAGMIVVLKAGGQPLTQEVERGGGVRDGCFVMMQGADQGGAGWDGQVRSYFQGAVDPSFEVGLAALLEFQEAVRQGVPAGRPGEVVAEVIMGIKVIIIG